MKNIIVLLDIDGTLVDIMQRTNTDELPALIVDLHAKGVRFGLNSNRALEDVVPVAERFGLGGPFILENGACFMESLDVAPIPTTTLPEDIPSTVERIVRSDVARLYPEATVECVDTTAMVTAKETTPGTHFYLNRFRKFSASIHHRIDGTPCQDVAVALTTTLNCSFVEEKLPLVAVAHRHGATITVEISGVDKGTGLNFLREKHPDAILIAIGDGVGEIALRSRVDKLYAVANAIPELKAVADDVSVEEITRGVVDLLNKNVRPLVE